MLEREGKKTLASELVHRITIQTKVETADGEGGFSDVWVDSSTVWAAVLPIRATQRAQYASVSVEATHIVKVRGDVSVSETQRIKFNNRYLDILTVENIQEKGVLKVVTCNEKR